MINSNRVLWQASSWIQFFVVLSQTRASGDYQPGNEQWAIALNAMWFYALGQRPFKDNYWSTKDQQCPKYPGECALFCCVSCHNHIPTKCYPAFQVRRCDDQFVFRCLVSIISCCGFTTRLAGKSEPYSELQSVVASLSAGPVGIGDGVGKSNASLIMR